MTTAARTAPATRRSSTVSGNGSSSLSLDAAFRLGLSPWDAPPPAGNQAGGGAAVRGPGSEGPGRLSSWALRVAAALLLPAGERVRWVEEWKGELRALSSRRARARFIASLLLAGGRELAVTLRQGRTREGR